MEDEGELLVLSLLEYFLQSLFLYPFDLAGQPREPPREGLPLGDIGLRHELRQARTAFGFEHEPRGRHLLRLVLLLIEEE